MPDKLNRIKCCVPNCRDKRSIRHAFPVNDETLMTRWIQNIADEELQTAPWSIYLNQRVCDRHFSCTCFEPGTKTLKPGSVPTLFMPDRSEVFPEMAKSIEHIDNDDLIMQLEDESPMSPIVEIHESSDIANKNIDNDEEYPTVTAEIYDELATAENQLLMQLEGRCESPVQFVTIVEEVEEIEIPAQIESVENEPENAIQENAEDNAETVICTVNMEPEYVDDDNTMEWNLICRVCLQDGDMVSVFDRDDNNVRFCDKISFCTSVTINKGENLPELICSRCVEDLATAYRFRSSCENSDTILQSYHHPVDEKPFIRSDETIKRSPNSTRRSSTADKLKIEDQLGDVLKFLPEDLHIKLVSKNDTSSKKAKKPPILKKAKKLNSISMVNRKDYNDKDDHEIHLDDLLSMNGDGDEEMLQQLIYKKKGQYSQRFRKQWKTLPFFTDWLREVPLDPYKAHCRYCNKDLVCKYRDLLKHTNTDKHNTAASVFATQGQKDADHDNNIAITEMTIKEEAEYFDMDEYDMGNEVELKTEDLMYVLPEEIQTTEKPTKERRKTKDAMPAKPHMCELCGKTFSHPFKLKAHYRWHTGEKEPITDSRHMCELCGKQYRYRASLTTHKRRHTGDKPFLCNICNKGFVCAMELARHLRVHSGIKPYQCKFCEKKYADYGSRIKHERTHTGERPYVCKTCGKSFAYSYVLGNHMLTHTGVKAYVCVHCGKRFTKAHHLKCHLNTHMQNPPPSKPRIRKRIKTSPESPVTLILPELD